MILTKAFTVLQPFVAKNAKMDQQQQTHGISTSRDISEMARCKKQW